MFFCKKDRVVNPTVKPKFQSGISQIDVDALNFCFEEAEKVLISTRNAIESLNNRAQTYINFCSIGISSSFAVTGFIFSSFSHLAIDEMIFAPAIATSLVLSCAIYYCFCVLRLSNIAPLGREPQDLLQQNYINPETTSYQYKILKMKTLERFQDRIDNNFGVVKSKADLLLKAYDKVLLSLAAFFFSFIAMGLMSFFC